MKDRTRWLALGIALALGCGFLGGSPAIADEAASPVAQTSVGQWGVFEVSLKGSSTGNPFMDVTLSAKFTHGDKTVTANGFYDGDGIYRVRCMPSEEGDWTYQTTSSAPELNDKTGHFTCTAPAPGNHGPVRVANTYHFAYADGTPFIPFGTTAYNFLNQPEAAVDRTLETLKLSPFNKVRACVFTTTHTASPGYEPPYPYPGKLPKNWDYTRFNPVFFQGLEKHVKELGDEGVEADLILFHPYANQTGFSINTPENDDRYLRYMVARLAAYHNVWWSLANEFDHIKQKSDSDWDKLFERVQQDDPYNHLRSVHNGYRHYNENQPWVTHLSLQNGGAVSRMEGTTVYRDRIHKPAVFDEINYEGNLAKGWGRMRGTEMVNRFWIGTVGGDYPGHGEAFAESPWTGIGGILVGESPARLAFLRQILVSSPAQGITPLQTTVQDPGIGGVAGQYYLVYFSKTSPTEWTFELPSTDLPAGTAMHVDVIDTWNMTMNPVPQVFKTVAAGPNLMRAEGDAKVTLPGTTRMALRITRIESK